MGPTTVRRAIVTGASRGIGRSLALRLARDGVEVIAVARTAAALAELAREAPGRIVPEVFDLADTGAFVARLRALDRASPVDLVIANAGAGPTGEAAPWSWESVGEALHTNLCGAAATVTALTDAMVARGSGQLVAIGSLSSFAALPRAAAYCAPKAGLRMLMGCLRLDLAPLGVRVTMVNLGFVNTSALDRATHPLPGLMQPDAVADAVVRRLADDPAEIDLPRGLALAARGAAALPASLLGPIQRALVKLR
ncbi:MAG: Oxidoreductase, short-chain dehydrogenase/reductase family [Myxococcaceae bacterium]|nr:Oxidoreductase, short-chain dehydrogenase/reductase family [Myxococcaceae bacterium]